MPANELSKLEHCKSQFISRDTKSYDSDINGETYQVHFTIHQLLVNGKPSESDYESEAYEVSLLNKTRDKTLFECILSDKELAESLASSFEKLFERMRNAVSEKQASFYLFDKLKKARRTLEASVFSLRNEMVETKRANMRGGFRADHSFGANPVVQSDDHLADDTKLSNKKFEKY